MNDQTIHSVPIAEEMKESYMSYAMSVIVGRALPDVRDGLKPVHRRILYGMNEMGVTSDKPYKKSARIVGDVMGKYHPHGDMAVYDTIVRMVQDFSMRYPLVDGQGNFGSLDGDSAAAMRYTEIRMAPIAEELLEDLDKDTVEFSPNFDDTMEEPDVLPSKVPNLLINGSSGIAVGMATNMAPHNLGEVVDGVIALIDDPHIELKELMEHVPGPDFPTGGYIYGKSGIWKAYENGRGRLKLRARAEIEEEGGRERIIITEIPYQVNKSKMIEDIASLVKNKKVEGIRDLRDESDKEGLRVVVELSKGAPAQVILNKLFKHTQMETTFGVINLVLVDGEPKVMGLKELMWHFIEHRKEVIVRRTQYDLDKAEARAHILEGLQVALDHVDEVISLIRGSDTVQDARGGLMSQYGLSEEQANAILQMRLQKLTGLEREKIDTELEEVRGQIEHYRRILASDQMVLDIVKEELVEVKSKYDDDRRTEIVEREDEISIEDLIPEEDMVVSITNRGYIKRTPVDAYRQQRRGGKGVIGVETKDEDFVQDVFVAENHEYLLFFTNKGKAHWLKVYELPEGGRYSRGKAIVNLLELEDDERITATLPMVDLDSDCYILMATRLGTVKKTACSAFSNPRSTGIIAIQLADGDELVDVLKTTGDDHILLGTKYGQVIRFDESDVRDMGRTAMGVRGIRLEDGDEVIGVDRARENATLFCITENGYGKRTDISEFPVINRGGKGVIGIKSSLRNGLVVDMKCVYDDEELIVTSQDGQIIRVPVRGIREMGRNTQGVKIMDVDREDRVVAVARMMHEEE